jgi:hypothetical protein
MTGQTVTRWKHGRAYRYGWHRCGFAAAKGPSVCGHSVGYRRDRSKQLCSRSFTRP